MKVKIMTFNIQHCRNYLKDMIDHELMANVIRDMDADICGLNEVRGRGNSAEYTAQAETLGSLLNMHSVFGLATYVRGTEPYGNAVVSKFPVIKSEVIPIPTPDLPKAEPRSILRCQFDFGLVVYQTHIGLSDEEKKLAADTIMSVLSKETNPYVLMGDFNITPKHSFIKALEDTDGISSVDTFLNGATTFPSDAPLTKIDYIFAGNGVKICSAVVPEIIASDHRPIVADIEF